MFVAYNKLSQDVPALASVSAFSLPQWPAWAIALLTNASKVAPSELHLRKILTEIFYDKILLPEKNICCIYGS